MDIDKPPDDDGRRGESDDSGGDAANNGGAGDEDDDQEDEDIQATVAALMTLTLDGLVLNRVRSFCTTATTYLI